jgi:hypothetical protein
MPSSQKDEEQQRTHAPAIRQAQPRIGQQSSLCCKYFNKRVIGKRKARKGTEVDDVIGCCKLCPVNYGQSLLLKHNH